MKEHGNRIGKILLWFLATVFVLLGIILLTTGSWSGILAILSGVAIAPVLRKRVPIKTWQQVVICIVLFFAAFALGSPKNTTKSPSNTDLQASNVPSSPTINTDQVFTVKFDSGEYFGTVSNNKPDGTGTLTYTNLGTYNGSFQDGKRDGSGTFTWDNGDIYSGEWEDDKIDGSGAITFSDGAKLTAVFNSNEITSGDYTWADSNGSFQLHIENSTDSEPIYTLAADYSNGVSYNGSFSNQNLNGQGTMVYPNSGTYSGGFENGKKSGDGQFTWTDGDSFSGKWTEDQMSGQGIYTFANGSTLSGNFESNVPQGNLIYTYQGKTYNTVWNNGTCTSITKA